MGAQPFMTVWTRKWRLTQQVRGGVCEVTFNNDPAMTHPFITVTEGLRYARAIAREIKECS